MKIDSGADLNVVSPDTYHGLRPKPELLKSKATIKPYRSPRIPVMGKFNAKITANGKVTDTTIYVMKDRHVQSLMGRYTAFDLDILQRRWGWQNHLANSRRATHGIRGNGETPDTTNKEQKISSTNLRYAARRSIQTHKRELQRSFSRNWQASLFPSSTTHWWEHQTNCTATKEDTVCKKRKTRQYFGWARRIRGGGVNTKFSKPVLVVVWFF